MAFSWRASTPQLSLYLTTYERPWSSAQHAPTPLVFATPAPLQSLVDATELVSVAPPAGSLLPGTPFPTARFSCRAITCGADSCRAYATVLHRAVLLSLPPSFASFVQHSRVHLRWTMSRLPTTIRTKTLRTFTRSSWMPWGQFPDNIRCPSKDGSASPKRPRRTNSDSAFCPHLDMLFFVFIFIFIFVFFFVPAQTMHKAQ